MGIDVEMRFRVPSGISDEDFRAADWELPAIVGHEHFYDPPESDDLCLRREDNDWVRVHLAGRLYAVGYERGDLLVYLAVADWLEARWPDVEIVYGGDDGEELRPWGKPARQALYAHWLKNGRIPYLLWESPDSPKGCGRCVRPLMDVGGNGKRTLYRCLACGKEFEKRAGVLSQVGDEEHTKPRVQLYSCTLLATRPCADGSVEAMMEPTICIAGSPEDAQRQCTQESALRGEVPDGWQVTSCVTGKSYTSRQVRGWADGMDQGLFW